MTARPVRVSPTPAAALPGDKACDVGPDDAARLDAGRAGRAVLHRPDGRRTSVLFGPDAAPRHGQVEVVVRGWRFVLDVQDAARAELVERATRDRAAGHGSGPLEVRAAIPGRVVAVAVAVGDEVEAGQALLVVEAMKMQNEVRASRPGTVASLAVGPGQTVELGDLLAVIESAA